MSLYEDTTKGGSLFWVGDFWEASGNICNVAVSPTAPLPLKRQSKQQSTQRLMLKKIALHRIYCTRSKTMLD